jgi:glutamate synthase (NADPH/NADH) small chain
VAGTGKDKGRVVGLKTVHVQWQGGKMVEVPGSEKEWKADLVLLAMGFTSPVPPPCSMRSASSATTVAMRVRAPSSVAAIAPASDKVFAAGDMRRGQSLVVWAIREGRQAARAVDEFLMGASDLPR